MIAFGLPNDVSLKTLGIICGCKMDQKHNAIDDAVMLGTITKNFFDWKIDKESLKRYELWNKQKKAYQNLRLVLGSIKQLDEGKKIIEMALKGEKFPNFE